MIKPQQVNREESPVIFPSPGRTSPFPTRFEPSCGCRCSRNKRLRARSPPIGEHSRVQPCGQVGRVELQHHAQFSERLGPAAQPKIARGPQIPAMDLVAPIQVVIEDRELGERHGEIVNDYFIVQMLLAELHQRFETRLGGGGPPQLLQGQPLIKKMVSDLWSL